jgi:hypothetical protein
MPKRFSSSRSKGVNQTATYQISTPKEAHNTDVAPPSKEQISFLMAEMGRKGGKIGGKRRLETMSAEERQMIAKKAAQARWQRKEK